MSHLGTDLGRILGRKNGHNTHQDGTMKCYVHAVLGQYTTKDGPKMFRRCLQDAERRFMLETPLGERSERASAASEASGAIRMDSVSCRVKVVQ